MTETPTTATDLEAVKDSLAEAETTLAEAEATAPQAALRNHLGKAEPGDVELLERLPKLRTAVDQLRLAVVAAEAEEAHRLAIENYKSDQARQRAAAQHLGALSRAAGKASRAIVDLTEAFKEMVVAGRAAEAVLPKAVALYGVVESLSARRFSRLLRAELTRHAVAGTERILDNNEWTRDLEVGGKVRSMLDILSEDLASIKHRAAQHAVSDPSAQVPAAAPYPAVDGDGEVAAPPTAAPLAAEPSDPPPLRHGWNAVTHRSTDPAPHPIEVFPGIPRGRRVGPEEEIAL